jgi:uncharacterized membrane protein
MRRLASLILIAFIAALLLALPDVEAQTRSVFWQRWDVLIDNFDTQRNRFSVTETHDVYFSGSFSFGSRVIEMTNLEDIVDVQVFQGNQPLQSACTEQKGTFCVRDTTDGRSIRYYFIQPINTGSEVFRIRYTVVGALRVYEGGDQLWWTAIPSEHFGFSIGSSTVTVELPPGFGPREGIDPIDTYGAPGEITLQGTRVQARAVSTITGNQRFEIRVQYPHDPQARKPGWQSDFDVRRAYEENIAPLVNLGALGLSLLVLIGGPLGVFGLWYTRGRDPKIGPVPIYLTEPPSNLPPAVAGSLVDEHVDTRDIISTIVDLARRGYIVMEEERTPGAFGIGTNRKFYFKRTDKSPTDGLRPFERRIVNQIFKKNRMECSLDSLRNSFYTVIPKVQDDLYKELVREKLFTTDPSTTRKLWNGVGIAVLVLAGVLFTLVVSSVADDGATALICLPLALAVTGGAAFVMGRHMPAKTRQGAEEAARWSAFREYLRNLEKYGDVAEAADRFDEFLPYAVAFGVDRSWVRKFSRIEQMPIPNWYFPTYVGGRYGRGYTPGTPLPRADYSDLARAGTGGFSVNDMAGNLTGGLQSMSDGLTEMLSSASRVITSQPQSSSSGGWSGGGFSGGGSSGGGSAGFG